MSDAPLLFRAELRRDAGLDALGPVLMPEGRDEATAVAHRLVWTLFPGPHAPRDFLFRQETRGRFVILSRRPPEPGALWTLPETPRRFAPDLMAGARLRFALRVNSTRTERPNPDDLSAGGKVRAKHRDVVMDAIFPHARGARAENRDHALGWLEEATEDGFRPLPPEPILAWMQTQGGRHGFSIEGLAALGYERVGLPRSRRAAIGVVDLEGALTVTDPGAFLRQVAGIGMSGEAWHPGFGRAKAFGCGLMLVRRA